MPISIFKSSPILYLHVFKYFRSFYFSESFFSREIRFLDVFFNDACCNLYTKFTLFVFQDINECTEGLDDCNTTFATCNNLDPGFECLCQVGFVDRSPDPHNDPGRNCVPVFDECYFDTPPVCHHLATCAVNDPPRKLYIHSYFDAS